MTAALDYRIPVSPEERAVIVSRAKAARARMEARRKARLEAHLREMFSPSYPPVLPCSWYPERAPGGALIVRCEMVGDSWVQDGLRVVRVVAEDGRSWLEIQEAPLRQNRSSQ